METKKNVALIYGGDSSEAAISVLSGKYVAANIDRDRYDVYEILLRGSSWSLCEAGRDDAFPVAEIDKSDFSCTVDGRKVRFDIACIMIHGTPGENGLLQGYLEMMGVPHTTCSAYVSALTFNKYSCKTFLRDTGIRMARDIYIRKGEEWSSEDIVSRLGLPLFVKPTDGGSSFGVTKVKEASQLEKAVNDAFSHCDSILVEEALAGRELTEGVFTCSGKLVELPVTEIVSYNEFFDYQAKYQGHSDEICPADIPEEALDRVAECTGLIYRHFGCKGLVRVDYMLSDGEPYFIEINTVPGMTPMSLVPKQVRASGMDMKQFFNAILDEALLEFDSVRSVKLVSGN